jgi:hypothetical protein
LFEVVVMFYFLLFVLVVMTIIVVLTMAEAAAAGGNTSWSLPRNPHSGSWARHKWFRELLEDRGQEDSYFGSIGGYLRQYSTAEDRSAWRNFEWDCAIQHAGKVVEAASIELVLC